MPAVSNLPRLRLEYPSAEAVRADHQNNLRKQRAFVPGATHLPERTRCELELVHPESGATLVLQAEAVWVKADEPGAGTGLQLFEVDSEALEHFVRGRAESGDPSETNSADADTSPRNIHERVRQLSPEQRNELARQGNITERTALERAFGGAVWEPLLQNPRLTAAEVARIAKGSLPRPLVNTIVSNGAWASNPEVQRALLGNPRTGAAELEKLLRAMPREEVRRISKHTGYRMQVRQAAKRVLG